MTDLYKSTDSARAIRQQYRELLSHWPLPCEHHHVRTCQGDTFAISCGAKTGPALLLLHGSMSNSAMWMGDVATWAPHFRVCAVDVIGEPGLSAPSRPSLASDTYAQWLEEVMDGLSVKTASLVAISLGGWFALDFAIRRPRRVDGLALICPGGIGRRKNFLWWAVPLSLMGPWGRRKVREQILGSESENVSGAARQFLNLMDLISQDFRPRMDILPLFSDRDLAQINVPMLAILPGRDVILDSLDTARRLEKNLPTAEIRYLPNAPHYPGNQSAAILDFLRRAVGMANG